MMSYPAVEVLDPGNIDNFIESGQAFLVSGNPISLPLTEDKKGNGSNVMVFLQNPLQHRKYAVIYMV